ncbi:hypothetical protein POM88_006531 [Heracleum sosnowskyi]|uniref:Uncharacterized protein n=1 Tax=Heracleum sosnowskyi TaxID=360622 RepID=A0AAD8J3V0_9APIA|nr:hypothetical protein POM88_006531 [Heracleum sosnowskyi]
MISLGSISALPPLVKDTLSLDTNKNHSSSVVIGGRKNESSVQHSSCLSKFHEVIPTTEIPQQPKLHEAIPTTEIPQLPKRLRPELMPNHVAIIMDGNRRPKEEVSFLLQLIEEVLKSDLEEFMRSGNRISVMGNKKNALQIIARIHSSSRRDNKGQHWNSTKLSNQLYMEVDTTLLYKLAKQSVEKP